MSIPFALSLSKYVNSAGTDVGFASLLAVALLALLYFAGARETRTLRDQLEEAHTRITSLEARVAQAVRSQAARASQATQSGQVASPPGRPGVVPAPSVLPPLGGAVARVRREAAAAVAGAPAVAGAGALLGAPAGAGAPSLGSATKLIPAPVAPAPAVAPAVPVPVTAAAQTAVPAAYPDEDDEEFLEVYDREDTLFAPAVAGAGGASTNGGRLAGGGAGGGGAVAAPPRMQFGDDEPQGPLPRRTIPTVDTGASAPRRFAGRLIGVAASVAVVAIIVVALLVITSGNSHTTQRPIQTVVRRTTRKQPAVVAFNPKSVKVSVLNGTGLTGVAGDIGNDLTAAGYTVPKASVTNAAVETVDTTVVSYVRGYKADALKVAQALSKQTGVSVTTVAPATQAAITSCATPDTGAPTGTCPAKVIVTVGSDLAGAAAAGNTGSGNTGVGA